MMDHGIAPLRHLGEEELYEYNVAWIRARKYIRLCINADNFMRAATSIPG